MCCTYSIHFLKQFFQSRGCIWHSLEVFKWRRIRLVLSVFCKDQIESIKMILIQTLWWGTLCKSSVISPPKGLSRLWHELWAYRSYQMVFVYIVKGRGREQGVGLDDLQSLFPAPPVLGFCDNCTSGTHVCTSPPLLRAMTSEFFCRLLYYCTFSIKKQNNPNNQTKNQPKVKLAF